MAFIENPEAYDVILLGGRKLPGEVHLGGEVVRELAKRHKRGSGDDGAEANFKGLKPADFTILMKLHTDDDEKEWERLLPLFIDLNTSINRNELSVVHPQLQRLGISRCIVHHIGESPPLNGDPILVKMMCSSVKVKTGGSHKPKPTKQSLPFTLFPLPDKFSGFPSAAAIKDRILSAVQQQRVINGIPIDIARASQDFPGATDKKVDNPTNPLAQSLVDLVQGR